MKIDILPILCQTVGGIGFLLFGMNMMSGGIQKSAGPKLNEILHKLTQNRIFAVFTGIFVTAIIHSSAATTVMVVSFVNAGLLSLNQSIGVIFGANIGTTVTAWIVAVLGFGFKISAFALPMFGVGFFLTTIKRLKMQDLGEALMGFGLLFVGLDFLTAAFPAVSAEDVAFLAYFDNAGIFGRLVSVVCGIFFTVLLHSSTATTTVIITLAFNGILSFKFAAGMVLGSNIGTTIDAVLASIGTKVNARRSAAVHVIFNVTGSVIAIIFLAPLLRLVQFLVPNDGTASAITLQIAMLHTIFNIFCTALFLPFVNQLAALTEKIIKPKEGEIPTRYVLDYILPTANSNAQSYFIRGEKEIKDLLALCLQMFSSVQGLLQKSETSLAFDAQTISEMAERENYVDDMKEQLSKFFLTCDERLPLSERQRRNVFLLMNIVEALEEVSDDCYKLCVLLKRSNENAFVFESQDLHELRPYAAEVEGALRFLSDNFGGNFDEKLLAVAAENEASINKTRKKVRKLAKERLKEGRDVKAELYYIDVVRTIEKTGDHIYSVAKFMARMSK